MCASVVILLDNLTYLYRYMLIDIANLNFKLFVGECIAIEVAVNTVRRGAWCENTTERTILIRQTNTLGPVICRR